MNYFILAVIFIIILAIFLYLENNLIDVTRYVVKSPDINGRLKTVHLSDLHSKPSKKILERTRALNPDVIFITGDFIDDKARNKAKMLDYAKQLCEIAPVYYITGNHERRLEEFESLMEELSDAGFNVLLNEVKEFTAGDNGITVLGLDENIADFDDYKARRRGDFEYPDMAPYFSELNRHRGFKIVLSHCPENFEGVEQLNYSKYDFDVQLSGHAHGGQFILPIIGPVYSPGQGIHPKYARGTFGDRPKLIVSRGIGNSEFPFRLFNHPEIIVLTISRKF